MGTLCSSVSFYVLSAGRYPNCTGDPICPFRIGRQRTIASSSGKALTWSTTNIVALIGEQVRPSLPPSLPRSHAKTKLRPDHGAIAFNANYGGWTATASPPSTPYVCSRPTANCWTHEQQTYHSLLYSPTMKW